MPLYTQITKHTGKYTSIFLLLLLLFVAVLALFGGLWRTQPLFSASQLFFALLGTVCFSVVCFFLYQCRKQRENAPITEAEWSDGLKQRFVRWTAAGGSEHFEAAVLVEFQEEQTTATVHIPFVPCFDDAPTVQISTAEPDAHFKTNIVQLLPYGICIDVKRSGREAQTVLKIRTMLN